MAENIPREIWANIFNRLPLRDHLNLLKVNYQFELIVLYNVWIHRFPHVYATNRLPSYVTPNTLRAHREIWNLPREQFEYFLSRNIYTMQTLYLNHLRHQFFTRPGYSNHRPNYDFYLRFTYFRLTELNLYNSATYIPDSDIRLLARSCPNLRIFVVSSRNVTGRYLVNFRELCHLSVPNCNIAIEHLDELLKKNENLYFLDIRDNPELLTRIIPSFYRNLRVLHLDEFAFFKQISWGHILPDRIRRLRRFNIACNRQNLPTNYNGDVPLRKEWQTIFHYFGPDIEEFQLCAGHEGIRDAVERVYNLTKEATFPSLRVLYLYLGKNNYLQNSKFDSFFESHSIRTAFFFDAEYNFDNIVNFVYNNRQLAYLCIKGAMKGVNLNLYLKFIDDIITVRKRCWDRQTLVVELMQILPPETKEIPIRKIFENHYQKNFLYRERFEIENRGEMEFIRREISSGNEGDIVFRFPFRLCISREGTYRFGKPERFEITFYDRRLLKRRIEKHVNEPQTNLHKEPYLSREWADNFIRECDIRRQRRLERPPADWMNEYIPPPPPPRPNGVCGGVFFILTDEFLDFVRRYIYFTRPYDVTENIQLHTIFEENSL